MRGPQCVHRPQDQVHQSLRNAPAGKGAFRARAKRGNRLNQVDKKEGLFISKFDPSLMGKNGYKLDGDPTIMFKPHTF
jgi:hypothetical protein